jgi:hypothetical protein
MISTRYELPELLDTYVRRQTFAGVEVGTDQGVYAAELLRRYPTLFLYTVDPWLPHFEIRRPDGSIDDRRYAREQYQRNMGKYLTSEGRAFHLELTSVGATHRLSLETWPNGMNHLPKPPFDLVYVDGEHTTEAVQQDLEAWWPLVKVGGILAGHDFDHPPVSKPVIAFAKRHRLDLQIINEHGGPDVIPTRPGSGQDCYGGWAHPSWFWYKRE